MGDGYESGEGALDAVAALPVEVVVLAVVHRAALPHLDAARAVRLADEVLRHVPDPAGFARVALWSLVEVEAGRLRRAGAAPDDARTLAGCAVLARVAACYE